jgi:predicted secreted Zn-dependent protease
MVERTVTVTGVARTACANAGAVAFDAASTVQARVKTKQRVIAGSSDGGIEETHDTRGSRRGVWREQVAEEASNLNAELGTQNEGAAIPLKIGALSIQNSEL